MGQGVGKIREFGENPKQSRYCNRNETVKATILDARSGKWEGAGVGSEYFTPEVRISDLLINFTRIEVTVSLLTKFTQKLNRRTI